MRAIGIHDFLARQFDTYAFTGPWAATFGEVETNFRAIVYGKPGQGKTEFCLQMAAYLASFGRVYYNSFEQGISKTLQSAIRRNGMADLNGRILFGDKEDFPEMMLRLAKKASPRIVFIDSRDYLNLTAEQFKRLCERFPSKAFVIICWESNSKPKGEYAKAIEFMCDIKVHVRDFTAHPRSRFGGNQPYNIWPDRPSRAAWQGQLF